MPSLTVFPDPHTESASVDGFVHRGDFNETFADLRAGAGTSAVSDGATEYIARLFASTTTDQFKRLTRGVFLFDTSALTADAVISSATLSIYLFALTTGLGTTSLQVVASTPASDTDLVAADYAELGTTSFASLAFGSVADATYNDLTLNASGLAAISKTGITKYGTRTEWDRAGSFDGSWSSDANTGVAARFADQADTTSDPKLVITYALPSTRFYLPSTGAAEVTVTPSGSWADTAQAESAKACVTTPIDSAMATITADDNNNADRDVLKQQYVSEPLAAQTIAAQTLKFQIRASEVDAGFDLFTAIGIRVVSNDGSSVTGTILGVTRDDTEMVEGTLTNRQFTATTTEVTCNADDRIVIEIGGGGDPAGGGDHDFSLRIGDDAVADLEEDDTSTTDSNPWVEFPNPITFATVSYDLELGPGSYSFSGTAMTPLKASLVNAVAGSYAATGADATFVFSIEFNAEAGAYAISGSDIVPIRSLIISVDPGAYSASGSAAQLVSNRLLSADAGSYSVSGSAAILTLERLLAAAAGAYSVSGADSGLLADRLASVDPGAYSVSGSNLTLLRSIVFVCDSGTYAVSGSAASLLADRLLSLEPGVYAITGSDATFELLTIAYSLVADPGSYVATGAELDALVARVLSVDAGAYTVDGAALGFGRSYILDASAGSYVVVGADGQLFIFIASPLSVAVPAEDRGVVVVLEDRGITVAADDRALALAAESRSCIIPADPRTATP